VTPRVREGGGAATAFGESWLAQLHEWRRVDGKRVIATAARRPSVERPRPAGRSGRPARAPTRLARTILRRRSDHHVGGRRDDQSDRPRDARFPRKRGPPASGSDRRVRASKRVLTTRTVALVAERRRDAAQRRGLAVEVLCDPAASRSPVGASSGVDNPALTGSAIRNQPSLDAPKRTLHFASGRPETVPEINVSLSRRRRPLRRRCPSSQATPASPQPRRISRFSATRFEQSGCGRGSADTASRSLRERRPLQSGRITWIRYPLREWGSMGPKWGAVGVRHGTVVSVVGSRSCRTDRFLGDGKICAGQAPGMFSGA
jgi:hypothetical protein